MQDPTRQDLTGQIPATHATPMPHSPEPRDSRPHDHDRDPDEIRRDIRQTRGDMDRTVDELVDRFSVGNLVDEAWQRMRRSGDGGPDLGAMLREHPVPIALVGLGLGWLAVERSSGRSLSPDTVGNGSATNGQGTLDGNGLADTVSDHASEAMSTARDKVSDLKASTKAAGSRTRAGLREFVAESPLAVGSIVFGLGLASGLALPSSDLENREIGPVSDRIKSRAGELGSAAAERAGEVGHEVVDTAVSETRKQVDDLRDEGGT